MALQTTSPRNVLTTIARSLVVAQEYTSVEDALQGMALSQVKRKIAYYQRRIRVLKRQYNTDFESLTAQLEGQATPEQEDDWLAWRSARQMLADWQKTYRKLSSARPRA